MSIYKKSIFFKFIAMNYYKSNHNGGYYNYDEVVNI